MLSCSDQNVNPELSTHVVSLEGKWIEKKNRQDTIIFDSKLYGSDRKMFSFRSANEISGYSQLHSTMYEFKIEGDKISLYNIISSCYCFKEYSFSLSGDKIEIGNFYHDNSAGEIETFERL
jgi:hypothetical protein